MEVTRGRLTLIVGRVGATIELTDNTSGLVFGEIKLNPQQFCEFIGGLNKTECFIKLDNLEYVNRKHLAEIFEFELPNEGLVSINDETIHQIALEKCPEGWVPDKNYSKKDSFFKKENKSWARTIIRKWE